MNTATQTSCKTRTHLGLSAARGEVLARVWAWALKHQGSPAAMGLTWAEKLRPMVNWMMPLLDRERAFELPRSGEKFCRIVLTRSRPSDS